VSRKVGMRNIESCFLVFSPWWPRSLGGGGIYIRWLWFNGNFLLREQSLRPIFVKRQVSFFLFMNMQNYYYSQS
jgi:hypothetical protein